MKIYINTASQPPTLAATFASKTDATGELRVYSSSFGSGISSLRFKRGTVVPFELAFPAAEGFAPPAKVRFGLKPAGQYDAALAAFAESVESKTEEICCFMLGNKKNLSNEIVSLPEKSKYYGVIC